MDAFDEILELVDDFGTYQRLLLGFVLLPGFIPVGFHAYNQLFMAASPSHFCTTSSTTSDDKSYNAVDLSFLENYQCHQNVQVMNVSEILGEKFDNETTIPCTEGWVYDNSTYISTVVTEWDLVCEKKFLPTLALIVLGLGGIVGTYIFGILQDTLGRKLSFFIYLGIQCFFGVGTALALNYWMWLFMRFGVGLTVPALMATPFVLALELVGSERRSFCTIVLNVGYSMCLMAMAWVAYLFRNWRSLALATSLPFLTFFSFWWVMPESPRWLFAHGKLKETEEILRKMANVNSRNLPPQFSHLIQEKYKESQLSSSSAQIMDKSIRSQNMIKYGVRDLLRGKTLRRNTLIITFIWFTTMGVYVGLSYYAPALGGDEFLNFFLSGLAEMPTYLFLFPCLDFWGRRWTLFASLILGGFSCIFTVLAEHERWVVLTLYCVGKFGISAAFVAIQQMAAEIYPTVVRGLGISFSNVVGMIGPALVPLVNYMGEKYLFLPLLLLGSLMVFGGMSALALPETLGTSLPQSLEDAELVRVECGVQSCFPARAKFDKKSNNDKRKNLPTQNYLQVGFPKDFDCPNETQQLENNVGAITSTTSV